ncbi:hypothetical protein NQZ68_018920 [Dissostichus eleginoides]|nr:hypothetical protein NQZ68_018920 [Dissostichus eleginoides]
MAIDRYVAICNPLRYSAIMTNKMVIKLTVSAWGVALVLVGILLGLTIRLNRCRAMITNPYCDNAALFKLSCESVFINNVYGLTFTVVLFTVSIGSMVITYTKITVVCLMNKNKSLNKSALCELPLRLMENYTFNSFTLQLEGLKVTETYVAICNPLRYAAIMTNKMVIKLTVSAWGVPLVLVGILLGLTIRLNRCRAMITNPYCDNAALFKLSCESVFINNVYGLTFTVVLFTVSIGSMVITYTKITVTTEN